MYDMVLLQKLLTLLLSQKQYVHGASFLVRHLPVVRYM